MLSNHTPVSYYGRWTQIERDSTVAWRLPGNSTPNGNSQPLSFWAMRNASDDLCDSVVRFGVNEIQGGSSLASHVRSESSTGNTQSAQQISMP